MKSLLVLTTTTLAKQIKINDDVHAELSDLAREASHPHAPPIPTIIPPLPYRDNFIFDGPNDCVSTSNADFKFTICPMATATQMSLNSLGMETHLLGIWTGLTYNHERDAIDGLIYRFGDTVGCERHREMRVDLSCGEAYDIVAMDEAEQCSYRARIEHPSACERDRLALYPLLLTAQAKDQFRRVKQAQNDEQLTVTGLEHYYKQLLVSDGLLVEDATIEASEAYEQWKSDNDAKSEYQDELDRLRAQVATLKSDLATCQSQSAFSDDFDPVL